VQDICLAKTNFNPVSLDSSIIAFQQRFIKTHWFFRPSVFTASKTAWKIMDRFRRDYEKRGSGNGK
jgi:hypothetical protein